MAHPEMNKKERLNTATSIVVCFPSDDW